MRPSEPGKFSNFADAEKASGFHIPRLNSQGWSLYSLEVKGPDFGSIDLESDPQDEAFDARNVRFVRIEYVIEGGQYGRAGHSLWIGAFRTTDPLRPIEGSSGPARDIQVQGMPALVQRTESGIIFVQWKAGDVHVAVRSFILATGYPDPIAVTLDKFLALLETVR